MQYQCCIHTFVWLICHHIPWLVDVWWYYRTLEVIISGTTQSILIKHFYVRNVIIWVWNEKYYLYEIKHAWIFADLLYFILHFSSCFISMATISIVNIAGFICIFCGKMHVILTSPQECMTSQCNCHSITFTHNGMIMSTSGSFVQINHKL